MEGLSTQLTWDLSGLYMYKNSVAVFKASVLE